MSLLTTKGVYGLMAIIEISKGDRTNPVSLKDISIAIDVSKNYLEQLLNSLRKDGIVGSIKGIKGGYYLSKAIDEITLYDIFNSLENEFNLVSLELENSSYDIFFKEYNEKLKELFMQPLSSIKIDQEQAGKYLNYII
ncbi:MULTISPECIES: RrF2 family transcriptional regulator [Campylobacter]|uniref:RrF2 family transcriptional regulator n=1 Tax=Campylobacter TaxID=194 RepID=UPI000A341728|nr:MULTISPECIES: Rrf2 family transcriptional regulator [Campylobacter]MBO5064108.1 Rrf2 family transcriptional regulator [Campylobacter sp.]MBQ3167219.1 Rrf2 family transcriptional regulator [Campylobacter sp.]MBQ7135519.1 Rrf2 family transcriptional regulator [Campylobacter sp.]MBQ8608613.1 Rrf2 family transcriptional regulator [Campylobacter sp.]MDL0104879.1 Rrf2 family transcriptional regulator [Campylobacter ovis]